MSDAKTKLDRMFQGAGFGTKLTDLIDLINEVRSTLNELISDNHLFGDCVLPTPAGAGAGFTDSSSAENAKSANAITIRHKGMPFAVAVDTDIDISALTGGGDTVAQSKAGIMWLFANTAGAFDAETDKAASAYDSLIEALAQYSVATNTLPPGTDDVPVGAVAVVEGGSGAFTWGTDSIATETETYYSFEGRPGVLVAAASFAADSSAATFTYGAVTVRLGTGTKVAATGKANVTISGSNVADGAVGAWLVYVLADDVEIAVQLGAAYATLAAAQAAVLAHNPNPLLPLIGVIYVENGSGATFVPGTTNLDATGVTTTCTTIGPEGDHLEIGRAQLNQPHEVLQETAVDVLI